MGGKELIKMDREKAEGLVKALIDTAYITGLHSGLKTGLYYQDDGSCLEATERRDELKKEIISYLTGEGEDK